MRSDTDLPERLQQIAGVTFPDAYIDTVRRHNAAAPALSQFHDGAAGSGCCRG
jgi:hypothetical protein